MWLNAVDGSCGVHNNIMLLPTSLTLFARVSAYTRTSVPVDKVLACSVVATWKTLTLVDFWKKIIMSTTHLIAKTEIVYLYFEISTKIEISAHTKQNTVIIVMVFLMMISW